MKSLREYLEMAYEYAALVPNLDARIADMDEPPRKAANFADANKSSTIKPRQRITSTMQTRMCLIICLVFSLVTLSCMSSMTKVRSVGESFHLPQVNTDTHKSENVPDSTVAEETSLYYGYTSAAATAAESVEHFRLPTLSIPPWVYFVLLALQCGCQPILVKAFTPKTLVRSSVVLAQEIVKLLISLTFLFISGKWESSTAKWSIRSAILAAGLPAGIFVIQNYCNLMANQALPPITFSVLNQTKTLSAAFCCFLLLGKPQSSMQVVSLFLLVFAALVIEQIVPINPCPLKIIHSFCEDTCEKRAADEESLLDMAASPKSVTESEETDQQQKPARMTREASAARSRYTSQESQSKLEVFEDVELVERQKKAEKSAVQEPEVDDRLTKGVLPALVASFLSGLAGTLTQKTLQQHARSTHLFNTELACFSSFFIVATLALGSPDGKRLREDGILKGWTWRTMIPIVTNATGGILVGLVTKHQGAVRKGFALIFGMLISGLLQHITASRNGKGGVTREQILGGCIGCVSLWMHASFPPGVTSR
jgi:hypothetical protein